MRRSRNKTYDQRKNASLFLAWPSFDIVCRNRRLVWSASKLKTLEHWMIDARRSQYGESLVVLYLHPSMPQGATESWGNLSVSSISWLTFCKHTLATHSLEHVTNTQPFIVTAGSSTLVVWKTGQQWKIYIEETLTMAAKGTTFAHYFLVAANEYTCI